MANDIIQYSVSDMEKLAQAIAKSGLFGIKQPEQALALMAISQAEGLHPAIAARDYHIVNGRPTLKADAMLARFQAAGGRVEWHSYTDEACEATFSHPQGGTVKVLWDMDRVKKAEIKLDMYKKYPRQMLRARTISEGIRTIYPGVLVGNYTPEEAEEFEPPKSAMRQWAETAPSSSLVIEQEDSIEVWAKEFAHKIDNATCLFELSELISLANPKLAELKQKLPAWYNKLSQNINKVREACQLSEDAE